MRLISHLAITCLHQSFYIGPCPRSTFTLASRLYAVVKDNRILILEKNSSASLESSSPLSATISQCTSTYISHLQEGTYNQLKWFFGAGLDLPLEFSNLLLPIQDISFAKPLQASLQYPQPIYNVEIKKK